MNDTTFKKLLEANPQVDAKIVQDSLDLIRQMRALDLKPQSVFASPAVDPYMRGAKLGAGRSAKTTKKKKVPKS